MVHEEDDVRISSGRGRQGPEVVNANGNVRLFLFERGPSVLASQCRRNGRDYLSITASQLRKTTDRWGCEFREESANDFSGRESKVERSSPFLDQDRNRAYAPGHVRHEHVIVAKITK